MNDIGLLYDEVNHLRRENEHLVRQLEKVGVELKMWKTYCAYILELQTEAIMTQPMQPIIIRKDELGLGSSAAEVAAKQRNDKEA